LQDLHKQTLYMLLDGFHHQDNCVTVTASISSRAPVITAPKTYHSTVCRLADI
jgi:hypothetical protein